jgi:iron complex outermembrane receptor protein
MYYNAAYIFKKVNSLQNYRAPYWEKLQFSIFYLLFGNGTAASYVGYVQHLLET